MSFSSRLKLLRKEHKLTQVKVADFVKINARTFQKYEAGDFDPALSVLVRLADLFNVSLDYLVGRSDDPKRY